MVSQVKLTVRRVNDGFIPMSSTKGLKTSLVMSMGRWSVDLKKLSINRAHGLCMDGPDVDGN